MHSDDPIQPQSPEVLDRDILQQLVDLDEGSLDLVREMYQLYQQDMPSRLEKLKKALQAQDLPEVANLAHAIKGAASTMGTPVVSGLAQILESGGHSGHYAMAPDQAFERLAVAYQEALQGLKDYLAKG